MMRAARSRSRRRILTTLGVLALAVGAVAAPRAEIIEQVIVKVNGEIITKTDLENRQADHLRSVSKQGVSDADLKKYLTEVTPTLLVDAIHDMLIIQRGKELGYKLTDDRFKQALDGIRKENKLETEEQFQAALKAENWSMADLRTMLEQRMVTNQVVQSEVMGRISVTEEEARKYYEAHKTEFTSPTTYMLRELLVTVPKDDRGVNVAADEAAKAKAEALRARVAAGEGFEKIVAEASEAASKANGGLVGPINRDELDPTLRAIFDPLKAGQVTPVFRTSAGYQVYKIESMTEQKTLTYEAAREQIGDKVAGTKRQAEYVKYLRKLRGEAIIDWKHAALKKLYDQRLAQMEATAAAQEAAPSKGQ